jgi:membrane protein DedA with SNARE-associated domain
MVDWIAGTIERLGYLGVALLMLVETLIPPIPSELIMPLVGLAAARGELSLAGATAAAIAGATAGATFWYYLARAFGPDRLRALADRHGRLLGLSGAAIDRPAAWFARHGGWTIFLARILPGMRVYISIPAGLTGMGLPRFLGFTAAGFSVWYGLLGVAGYALGLNIARLGEMLTQAAPWLWASLAAAVAWRAMRLRRGAKAAS